MNRNRNYTYNFFIIQIVHNVYNIVQIVRKVYNIIQIVRVKCV